MVKGDISTDGVAVLANTLELNGGTIRSTAAQMDAGLGHAGLDHNSDHKVDWQPGAPEVTGVAISSDAGDDDIYALGDTIQLTATFSEAMDVDTSNGTPRLKIKMAPTWGEFWADYSGGSGTTTLTFDYTVVKPNTSPGGIAVLANTLELNGGTIRSTATQTDARLGHAGVDHNPNHKVDWQQGAPSGHRCGDLLGPGRRRQLHTRRYHPGDGDLRRGGGRGHQRRHAAPQDKDGADLRGEVGRLLRRQRHDEAGLRLHRGRAEQLRLGVSRCLRTRCS